MFYERHELEDAKLFQGTARASNDVTARMQDVVQMKEDEQKCRGEEVCGGECCAGGGRCADVLMKEDAHC
eukprot:1159531-Pelagomonas_calceolata.AAC.5